MSRRASTLTLRCMPEQVAHHERELRLPIVEHEAARVQFVVHSRRRKRHEAADDHRTEFGRDVARRRAGAECVSRKRGAGEQEEGENDGFHGCGEISSERSLPLFAKAALSRRLAHQLRDRPAVLHDVHGAAVEVVDA